MNIATNRFLLSAEECELLLELEEARSLQTISQKLGRDHSVISRNLKRISEKAPVVEKKSGRWVLTEVGKKFNETSRLMIATQSLLNQSQQSLRIGTNREFSARVIGPSMKELLEIFPHTQLTINSYEHGTEEALLKGQIDIGIDCDRPNDPEIGYKLLIDEPIIAVCGKAFLKAHKEAILSKNYFNLPYLLCERLHPDKILSKLENHSGMVARFNDIATARAACIQGIGWSLLPEYAIQDELEAKTLIQMDHTNYGKSKYGVRWIRNRSYLKKPVEKIETWLKSKEL